MTAAAPVGLEDFWALAADALDPGLVDDHGLPTDWEGWLRELFPSAVSGGFAPHHREFWEWVWSIGAERPRPFVAILARGAGKSTSAELAVAALGARGVRRYAVYVSSTQEQANNRVADIAALLESESVAMHFPSLGRRAVSKFGSPRGWRRTRLQTALGYTVDSLGLDTAARSAKVEDQRPDLIVLDDLDSLHDSELITKKKIETLTQTILPMGAHNLAVLAMQNLIIPTGIFAQLADDRADFLADRVVSGPVPAVHGLQTYRWEPDAEIPESLRSAAATPIEPGARNEGQTVLNLITGGEPSWEGQGLEKCQGLINSEGLGAFLRERQHEVDEVEGALWKKELFRRVGRAPTLRRVVIGVDPSGGRAEIGIVVCGLGHDGLAYVLADLTQPGHLGPLNWGSKVVGAWDRYGADRIPAERNFGGDMVIATIQAAAGGKIPVHLVNSSRGKVLRAEPIVTFYEDLRVRHVGVFPELETEMTRWVAGDPSPNRIDALVFALTDLLLPEPRVRSGARSRPPGS